MCQHVILSIFCYAYLSIYIENLHSTARKFTLQLFFELSAPQTNNAKGGIEDSANETNSENNSVLNASDSNTYEGVTT